MESPIQFVITHSYVVLFVWVVLEQGGLPIPAVPILLAAGALAGTGQMQLPLILGIGVVASLVGDVGWYALGRWRGPSVLRLLCQMALEPVSCVRETEDLFARRGGASLLVAKFIPGLSTVAPPLAGIIRMPLGRFLLCDGVGALLWVGCFVALGLLFSEQLERLAVLLAMIGSWLLAILAGAFGAYLVWKVVSRQRFLQRLRIARITPEALHEKIKTGEAVLIVDLRHSLEFDADPVVIPGAIRLSAEELNVSRLPFPPDREVVLYCS